MSSERGDALDASFAKFSIKLPETLEWKKQT